MLNFEYLVWAVFLLTAILAGRQALLKNFGRRERSAAVAFVVLAFCLAAIGLVLGESRWYHTDPRLRAFLLILAVPTVPLFGLGVVWTLVSEILRNRFVRGLDHLKNDRCPNCGYPKTIAAPRCSERGWPSVDPHRPLMWPSTPKPQTSWPISEYQAKALYVRWTLTMRESDPALTASETPTVATSVAKACMTANSWPNARFHADDSWELITRSAPGIIKPHLERELKLKLTHTECAKFVRQNFQGVVDHLTSRLRLS